MYWESKLILTVIHKYVAVCCCFSLLQRVAIRLTGTPARLNTSFNNKSGVGMSIDDMCCSVLQCVAVCCSVLQRVAV